MVVFDKIGNHKQSKDIGSNRSPDKPAKFFEVNHKNNHLSVTAVHKSTIYNCEKRFHVNHKLFKTKTIFCMIFLY